jgi:cytochrome c
MRMFATALALTALGATLASLPISAADVSHGESLFKENCAICHTHIEGLMDKSGPNLRGLFSRQAGTTNYRFGFTEVLARSGIQWRAPTLDLFLQAPARMMPGTKMVFPGLKSPEDRADLICYLQRATNTGDQPLSPDCE